MSFDSVPKSIFIRISLDMLDYTDHQNIFSNRNQKFYEKMSISKPFITYKSDYFDENDFIGMSNETTVSTTTIMMTTELTTESAKDQDELMWKMISLVFIILTSFLLILSICLWRALPLRSDQRSEEIPRLNEEVVC